MADPMEEGGSEEAVEAINLNTEEHVERLLSERLVDGYLLLEKACPACATPLVKREAGWSPRSLGSRSARQQPMHGPSSNFEGTKSCDNLTYGAGIDSVAYESPIQPIAGVPFCVSCQAHVVTNADEVVVLETVDHLKVRGTIMVAMSRETLEEGEESITTPLAELDNNPRKEDTNGSELRTNSIPVNEGTSANEQQEGSVALETMAREAFEPGIEAKGSKFSTKSILKSRSGHVSMASVVNGAGNQPSEPTFQFDGGPYRHDALMMDDEDDEISLQEIEVVHLDDQTSSSEVERKVIAEDDGMTTAEKLFLTQRSSIEAGKEEDNHDGEDHDFGSYHSSHYNQIMDHPLRNKPVRFGGDSIANTSIAVLRSDTSIPIYPTESRANTSIAAIRGDISLPVAPPQGRESPTNTSLGVLRGDPSGRMSVSNANASAQRMQEISGEGSSSPHLRRDMMERANSAANPILDESVAAVTEEDTRPSSTERELDVSKRQAEPVMKVDRFRSLITHSEDTPSPASFMRKPSQSIGSSQASYGPKHVQQSSEQNPAVKATNAPHTQQSVPIEALVSYHDRRAVATRVLGKKMIQGYSLTEHKCVKCQMPLMEKERVFYCVVCPVLRQHYKKAVTESFPDRSSIYSPSSKSMPWDIRHYHEGSMAIDSPPRHRDVPVSPAKPSSKRHLTIDSANSEASSRKALTVQRMPRTLTESCVQNEMSVKSMSKLSHPDGSTIQCSPRTLTKSSVQNEMSVKALSELQHPDGAPAKKSSHSLTSTESTKASHHHDRNPISTTDKEPSISIERSISAEQQMTQTDVGLPTSPSAKSTAVLENDRDRRKPPKPSLQIGGSASIRKPSVGVEAATQTSPTAKPPSMSENVKGDMVKDELGEKGSKYSEMTSLPPNPPSTIVSDTHDDESAKMSSITESYVTSFSAGTSRRSSRERDVKVRSQKPSLSRVKHLDQLKARVSVASEETKVSNNATENTASVKEMVDKSGGWRIDTESVQKNEPACIESLQSLSSKLHQIIDHGALVGGEERSCTSKQRSNSSNQIRGSSLGEILSDTVSETKLVDSVIHRKTKRLQELENARKAHQAAENESTGMLAEFNHMLQEEILKEEMGVRSEIEAAVIQRREAEKVEQQQAEERIAYMEAIRLAELEKAAETAQREAEEAMEKTRLAIEHVSSQLASDNDGNRIESPTQRHLLVEVPSRIDPPREIETPNLRLDESPTTEYEVSPRGRVSDLQMHFNSQRAQVTKEIGKRMMKGWNLLDASCPNCVMPLLTDRAQKEEVCVLCGVVGEIEDETVERSVKTWTKGERNHAIRKSSDSKRASGSRKTTNSSTKVDSAAAHHKKSSDDDTSADRRRLKRELLREIIAETTAYMGKRKGNVARTESRATKTSDMSTGRLPALLGTTVAKTSKKDRLRDIVKEETMRATERIQLHSPRNILSAVADISATSSPKKSSKTKHDPASSQEKTNPVLSLLRRGGEESSRSDPPASVAGSARNKTAVDADGAASWLEPLDEYSGPSSPMNDSEDAECINLSDPSASKVDVEPKEAVLSPSGESVVVLEIPKGFDVNDEPTLRELIKSAQREKSKQEKDQKEVDLKLDTSFQLTEQRRVHPSPGMTEATLPETNSPAHSKFTTNSDFSTRATYHEIEDAGRSTAPVPSPGISVAPEPEIELPTRRSLDVDRRHGARFPSSRRPAASPGIDRIEKGMIHDDEESYVGIAVSRSAPTRTVHARRHGLSPERLRLPERRNKVAAIRPYTGRGSSAVSEARIEPSAKRSTPDPRQAPESPSFSTGSKSGATEERSVVSSSSRPRITPESMVRPRSTLSTSSHDSAGGNQGRSSEGQGTSMLANAVPTSESMPNSVGGEATSRATRNARRQPLVQPPLSKVPSFASSSARGRGGVDAEDRALLVQGELEQEAPDPIIVLPSQPILGGRNQERAPPPNEDSDRVLSSRDVVVVEGGPLSPGHGEDEDGYDDNREDDDALSGRGSVGSATLDAVLARIEETKRQLENAPTVSDDGKSITIRDVGSLHGGGGGGEGDPFLPPQPHKLRELIDSLAAAAEEIEKQDRLDMSICF